MITSEDFNAYLLRTFAAMIESDKFDISAYNENYASTKSIKIFVFDSVNKRSYNYNAMKDSVELTLWLKTKAVIRAAFTLILIPYIIVTIGRFSYAMLINIALQIYFLYANHLNRVPQTAQTQQISRAVFEKAVSTVMFIFLALIGMENFITELFDSQALMVLFTTFFLELFYSICCRTKISKQWFPRFVYLIYFFTFYHLYYYSYDNCAILAFSTILSFQYLCVYFFHHFELPLIEYYWHLSSPTL